MRVLLTVVGLLGLVVFVSTTFPGEHGVADVERVVANRYAALEAVLDETLASLDRPPVGTVTLVVRAGPRIELESGDVYDLDGFAAFLAASDGAWDDHRVTLDVERGVTYAEVIPVVDRLIVAELIDIVYTGAEPVEDR